MQRFIRSLSGRAFTSLVCVAFLSLGGCIPEWGLEPQAGLPEYQSDNLLPAGHAFVNPAGGNLSLSLPALVVDTPLGSQSFTAIYNSATRSWTFAYDDLRYDASGFLDPSGLWNSLRYLAPYGRPIPTNRFWVPLDARRIKSAGGMVYEFDPATRRLRALYRSSADYPRLEFFSDRTLQCSAPGSCEVLFEIERGPAGRITAVLDRPGPQQRRAEFLRAGDGRLIGARSAGDIEAGRAGLLLEYSPLRPGLLMASTNSEGERVEYSYDFWGRLSKHLLAGGLEPTTRLHYGHAQGLAFTRIVDPLGRETVHRHDWLRQLREVTDAEGWTHHFLWSGLQLTRHETPAGTVTRWIHGSDTTTVVRPSGHETSIRFLPSAFNSDDLWSPAVLEISDVDASGAARILVSNSYDSAGLRSATSNGNGDVTSFAYGDGMLTHRYSPAGNPGSNPVIELRGAFGPHGHPTQVGTLLYGFEFLEPQTFTSAGDITTGSSIDHPEAPGRPNITALRYDGDRNLSAIDYGSCVTDPQTGACSATLTAPDEGTTHFTRRSDGRPLTIERPLGNDTEFVYDLHGRLRERRDRVGGTWQSRFFDVDVTGSVISETTPNGSSVEIEYNANGWERLVTWRRPGSPEMSRQTLYASARPIAILDSERGGAESITYDYAGRPAAVDYPGGERIEIEYGEDDREQLRRWRFSDGSVNTLETEYDGAGIWSRRRLDGATVAEQVSIGGKRHRLAFGAGPQRVEREFSYSLTDRGRLGVTTTRNALGATLEETWITRSYEAGSQVTRVAGVVELPAGSAAIVEVLWAEDGKDGVGPRIWGDGETQVVPGLIGPSHAYAYDALGNRNDAGFVYNADHSRLLNASGRIYSFDAEGYVSQIDEPTAGTTTAILRNAQGRSIGIQKTGQPEIFRPLDSFGRPLAGLFGGQVALGPSGERTLELAELRLDLGAGGCHLGRYDDLRGNVSFTVDTCTGTPQKAIVYDAYGRANVLGADDDDRAFSQGRQIADDLVMLGLRLYEPSTGRFLSPDPVYAVGSQFAYAEGNPLALWDPTGGQATAAEIRSGSVEAVFVSAAVATVSLAIAAATVGVVSTVAFGIAGFAAGVMIASFLVYLIATGVLLLQPSKGIVATRRLVRSHTTTPHLRLLAAAFPSFDSTPVAVPSACGLGYEFGPLLMALLMMGGPARRRRRGPAS